MAALGLEIVAKDESSYYSNKLGILERMFNTSQIMIERDRIVVAGKIYPVLDDVIITLAPDQFPEKVRRRLGTTDAVRQVAEFSEETQFTFGTQWNKFDQIEPEHRREFEEYFDLVDLSTLRDKDLIDFGCGMGRWSFMMSDYCRNIVLLDFSEAIFAARRLLRNKPNAIFVMGDIHHLPLADNAADLGFSLGVLHHMPTDALDEVLHLLRVAPKLLIYLYYAMDNRPFYFRLLFRMMNALRRRVGGMRNETMRDLFVTFMTAFAYLPFVWIATTLRPCGLDHYVPMHTYQGKSFRRIRQDAYDKLLTRVEQRFSLDELEEMAAREFLTFRASPNPPYWHFLCER